MAVYTRQPKNRGCMPNEGSDDCWTMDYQTACKENIGPDQLPPVQKSYKNVQFGDTLDTRLGVNDVDNCEIARTDILPYSGGQYRMMENRENEKAIQQ